MKPSLFIAMASLLLPTAAGAQSSKPGPKVGDTHEIVLTYETSSEGDDGSSASSQGHQSIVERVIGVRTDGVELEYDVPRDDPKARRSEWQFPARIFRPFGGEPRLINRAELEGRLAKWLKQAKMTRQACGRWIFTWTANRIECDPQSAIEIVKVFDLGPADLREGILYRMPEAHAPAPVTRKATGPEGSSFAAELEVDPETVRRERAGSDVAVGEMSGEPVAREAAARRWAKAWIAGTISVVFETDQAGEIRRRTTVSKLEIREPGGRSEKSTQTQTLERKRIAAAAARR